MYFKVGDKIELISSEDLFFSLNYSIDKLREIYGTLEGIIINTDGDGFNDNSRLDIKVIIGYYHLYVNKKNIKLISNENN